MPRLRRPALMPALALGIAVVAGLTSAPGGAAAGRVPGAVGVRGSGPGPMPGLGPVGTATMHGDAGSSDTTPNAGPGAAGITGQVLAKGAACPTILAGADGLVVALCTKVVDRSPQVLLLDPASGTTLATLPVAKGALLGGVYAYLDDRDRLVLVDGTNTLLRVRHERAGSGWRLAVDESTSVASFVTRDGAVTGDAVVGLVPDRRDHVWLATRQGRVGVVGDDGTVAAVDLPSGERVDNSISASRKGVAVATSHALYLLDDAGSGPSIVWRAAYDRGTARKPGQLSWGTGATPTFFGPKDGDEYVTITDNADGQEHLVVLRTADGSPVCAPPVFAQGASGTENSAIGSGRTVIVASTYGYPYPALPEGAGPSVPLVAQFTRGGIERFDVAADGSGCTRTWTAPVLSSAVPRWSLADGLVYTVERPAVLGLTGSVFDAVTLDAATGAVRSRDRVGPTVFQDTLEMVGTITPDRTWWQGTETGVIRMSPRRESE